jgi:hypothetical protein
MPRNLKFSLSSSSFRLGFFVLLMALGVGLCQTNAANSSNAPNGPNSGDIVQFLGKTIAWYHGTAVEQQIANEPTDVTFVDNNRRTANQVVQLAFDFARQQAQLEAKQPKTGQPQNNALSQYQSLVQAAQNADQQVQQLQGELQPLKQKLETASGKKRADL